MAKRRFPLTPNRSHKNLRQRTVHRSFSKRRLNLETLEARQLLAGVPAHAVYAPGTPWEYVEAFEDALHPGGSENEFRLQGSRWTVTASGTSPNQGDQVTITWSIMPDGTKLMEPFINLGFDGPQHDDILGAQRLYGDAAEPNDTLATATNLGILGDGALATAVGNSVDDDSDIDMYRFRATGPFLLNASVMPAGRQYLEGPQGGPYNPFDTNVLGDLTLSLLDATGQVIASVNSGPAGAIESLVNFQLPVVGDYFLRVTSTSDNIQPYSLSVALSDRPAAPRLLAVQANDGTLVVDGQVRHTAPRELRIYFDGGSALNAATLANGIRLRRSGRDGNFSDGDEVVITPGFIGLGDTASVVIMRFAEPLTDDFYQLEIIGTGPTPLASITGQPFNNGEEDVVLDFRLDLGAQVVAVVPQPVERNLAGKLVQRLNQIVVHFNDDPLNRAQAEDPAFYQLVRTAGTLTGDDDTILLPQSVAYDRVKNTATLTFASNLDMQLYRLQVGVSAGDDNTLAGALKLGTLYNTANDFSTTAFTGDAGGVSNNPNDVDLYRFEVTANTTVNVRSAPQAGHNTVIRLFDQSGAQVAISNNGGAGVADTLSQAITGVAAGTTYYVGISSSGNTAYSTNGTGAAGGTTTGSYLLEIDVTANFSTSDNNSTLATAAANSNIGTLGAFEQVITGSIQPQGVAMRPEPGGPDEPGHRQIPPETHGIGPGVAPVAPGPVVRRTYSFDATTPYGTDLQGNPLYNAISPEQIALARQIFEIYASTLGVEFVEIPSGNAANTWVITGDIRAVAPSFPPTGVGGIASGNKVIMNALVLPPQADVFGGGWFGTAFHEIGHNLGLSHSYDIPSVQGSGVPGDSGFAVYPGDHDLTHLKRLFRPAANDVDLYRFVVSESGRFTAETVAERLTPTSFLNSQLILFDAAGNVIAQNDDYYSNDSFLDINLSPGTYYIGVSSTGNNNYDPHVANTGGPGTTDGAYQLKLNFASNAAGARLTDVTGTALDGDADGRPGGQFLFWFEGNTAANTFYVDKANDINGGTVDGNGTLNDPFDSIQAALDAARLQAAMTGQRQVVRIVGNGGSDNNLATTANNRPYLIGSVGATTLDDGDNLFVPKDVTVMVDAGAILKFKLARVDVGTSSLGDDRSNGAFQALGTPQQPVYFTSYHDDALGGNSDAATPKPVEPGDWGGIVFRADSGFREDDSAGAPPESGAFLNSINHASITYGGGRVAVNSVDTPVPPIQLFDARPTIWFTTITNNNDAAISANPNSFDDRLGRIGPDVHHNRIFGNSLNGLFVRIETQNGQPVDRLEKFARFDDTDIVHIINENLIIHGEPGGPYSAANSAANAVARLDGRLKIDPGITLKLQRARIEAEFGATLIAEGTAAEPIVITSLRDDRYGFGDRFDTNNDGAATTPAAGDWAGLVFRPVAFGAIDSAVISYGGGSSAMPGGFDVFNTVEIHQNAQVRIANSRLEHNASGQSGTTRQGLGTNRPATIFVRGAQPVIVNNIIHNNLGHTISINANALQSRVLGDPGRSTGPAEVFDHLGDNRGPLVRLNRLGGSSVNGTDIHGMEVRAQRLTIDSIWDDTDIVHIVRGEMIVDHHHTYSGLRLQSSETESLVVKLTGPASAGFTASGTLLDIDDRIGGTVQVIGAIGHPVILTSLADDTVGAGFDLFGRPQNDTNGNGPSSGSPGDWRSVLFNKYSNDRNVAIVLERERAFTDGNDQNGTRNTAQFLGQLAKDEKSGDDNLRLGFQVEGFIALDHPADVDVYSFEGQGGSEVWFDIDRTAFRLDTVLELVNGAGTVIASSDNGVLSGAALPLTKDPVLGDDFYTSNRHDTGQGIVYDEGFRATLPGAATQRATYFVRVRSKNAQSRGEYQLNIRLRQVDNLAASTVRHADIRFATNGIQVIGLPYHSPLLGESAEPPTDTTTGASNANALDLGNLLVSDRNVASVAGNLSGATDVDWYTFELGYDMIQAIGGVNAGGKSFAGIFDIDFADGIVRADTIISVFNQNGQLILMGRDSNIEDDQPAPGLGNNSEDLTRGSFGKLDPFIGTQQLPAGSPGNTFRYYVAVSTNAQIPAQADATLRVNGTNVLTRLEPINSVRRIVEDHIGFTGYSSNGSVQTPVAGPMLGINNAITLRTHVIPYTFRDVALFVIDANTLYTVNPFTGQVINTTGGAGGQGNGYGDLAMRPDGRLIAQTLGNNNGNSGRLDELNTGSGGVLQTFGDDGLATNPDVGSDFQGLAARRIGVGNYQILAANNRTGDNDNDPANGLGIPRGLYRITPATGAAIDESGAAGVQPFGMLPTLNPVTGLTFTSPTSATLLAVEANGDLYRTTVGGAGIGGWTLVDNLGAGITGITLGPQNLDVLNSLDTDGDGFPDELADGVAALNNVMFATTTTGRLLAFDISTVGAGIITPFAAFDSNLDGIADATSVALPGIGGTRGLAFSPLDYNLWHPTTRRGSPDEPGHGINPAFDNSRTPGSVNVNINGRSLTQAQGGASFYFGLEQYDANANTNYFKYGSNGQFGVFNAVTHEELSQNPTIANTYNLPGGAYGAMVTNPFSLAGYDRKDKPTLYFNYFLHTQNTDSGGSGMRDSARVYVSNDNGVTWTMLATNNSTLNAELPADYLSEARDERPGEARQHVQELFETQQWRQARIDLADFVGLDNLRLRFEFSTSGSFNQPAKFSGDAFGAFTSNQRGQNNQFEGFYVDDIIVGFAERGEMVTGAQPDATNFFNKYANARTTPPATLPQILQGPYQLEIRRGTEYITGAGGLGDTFDAMGNTRISRVFDTNQRLVRETPISTVNNQLLGDDNFERDQGHIQIENNQITGASQFGIVVDAGLRDVGGSLPYPGSPRNTITLNSQRLAPGVTIVNNVISDLGQGGIHFSGDPNTGNVPLAAVPFGRILNNTIYGGTTARGVGIQVTENASPTILNNILSNLQTGISVTGSPVAPVANYNLRQSAPLVGIGAGTDDFVLAAGAPLFVDPANRNFYLVPNVVAIDSSINSLEDRPTYVGVKTPLGIPASVIRAPNNDVYGQVRIDVAGVDPTGQGSQVFKDRGAVEAADVDRPYAVLLNPEDNDLPGVDIDPGQTFVHLRDGLIDRFRILLGDGLGPAFAFRGTGLNLGTVLRDMVRVRQDGRTLQEGVDYTFGYSASSGIIELTPLSGIWKPDSLYTIDLNNRNEFTITAPSGLGAIDGDQFVIQDEQGGRVTFEFESGFTLRVPRTLEITVSPLGGAPGGVNDGQTFQLSDGNTTVTFEFDSNNSLTNPPSPTYRRVTFSQFPAPSTADQIAAAIVAAIRQNPPLGFAPTALPGGVVHLGSTAQDTVDVTNAPSLTVTGVAAGVEAGQFFTVRNGNPAATKTVTFQFTTTGAVSFPTNVPILIQPEDTNLQIAEKVRDAINAQAVLELTAVHLGDGRIHLGGRAASGTDPGHLIDTDHTAMTQAGRPGVAGNLTLHLPGGQIMRMPDDGGGVGGVRDGDLFTINDGANLVVFEFDSNGVQNLPTAVPILFSPSPTPTSPAVLATRIVNAINGSTLTGLNPTAFQQGGRWFVNLGGPPNVTLNTSAAPAIFRPYQPGLILDGERFTITVNGVPHTFEFDNNNSWSAAHRIPFASVNDAATILAAMRAAIAGAGIGLNPTIVTDTESLALDATARYRLDTSATRLTHDGVPGGAVPVVFVPTGTFTAQQMARRIFEAIITTPLLTGVAAELDEQRILLEGVASVLGIQVNFVPPIADLAGNPIGPNRADLSTKFTIVMPGVDIDYGDARHNFNPAQAPRNYPTLLNENGARHAIIGDNPLRLGSRVDADANGQPTFGANGDDNDFTIDLTGSRLTRSARAPYIVQVPASGAALPDGERFTIDIGAGPISFEFNKTGGFTADVEIPYADGDSANVLANKIVAAIFSQEPKLGLRPVNLGGGQVLVGGKTGDTVSLVAAPSAPAPSLTFPANFPLALHTPGAGIALQLPETFQLLVPAAGGSAIVDGRTFTIGNGAISQTFEFDRNFLFNAGNERIEYNLSFNQDQLANAILQALLIHAPTLGLVPSYLGDGVIHLGTSANHTVAVGNSGLTRTGQAGNVAEEDTFTFTRTVGGVTTTFTFEFNNTLVNGTVAGTNIRIDFNPGQTRDTIAQAIVAALNGAAGLGVTATHLGGGSIEVDGTLPAPEYTIDFSGTPGIAQLGELGGVSDGDTFTLQAGGTAFVFEFDRDGNYTLGNRPVTFQAGDGANALAAALVAALEDLPPEFGVNPTDVGGGTVSLSRDDEDGVTHGILNEHLDTQFTVVASDEGFLNAWIDFNQDGDFEDLGEHIFVNVALKPGVNAGAELVARTPSGSPTGITYARFRFSNVRGLAPTGLAEDGEVEDYVVYVAPGTPPVAVDDNNYQIDEDGVLTVNAANGVLMNDQDGDTPRSQFTVIEVNGQAMNVGQTITLPSGARLTLNADGSLQYVPDPDPANPTRFNSLAVNESDQDIFTYRLSDQSTFGGLPSNEGVVRIRVNGVNDQPTATNNAYATNEETAIAGNVLTDDTGAGVDSDPDASDVLVVALFQNPSTLGATVSILSDGSFTYNPATSAVLDGLALDETITDTFTYQISDGHGGTATATVSILVTGLNDAPTAHPVAYDRDNGNLILEDGPTVTLNFDADDVDSDDDPTTLVYQIVAQPSEGLVTLSGTPGKFNFHPSGPDAIPDFQDLNEGETRTVTFTYVVRDRHLAFSSIATVSITVTGVNDAPVASNVFLANVPEDGPPRMGQLVASDADAENSNPATLVYTIVSQPQNALGAFQGSVTNVGATFTFNPGNDFQDLAAGASRAVTFTYRVTDNRGAVSNLATGTVTVVGANDAPIGVNDQLTTDEDTLLVGPPPGVLGNDIDVDAGDTKTVSAVNGEPANVGAQIALASGALLTLNANGGYLYNPNGAFEFLSQGPLGQVSATDIFTYVVTDSQGASSTATVTVTITGVNDAPVAGDNSVLDGRVDEDGNPVQGTFAAADVDSDDPNPANLVYAIVTDPTEGSARVLPGGRFEFAPGNDFQDLALGETRQVTFTYTATDRHNVTSTPGTVTVTVHGANDTPTAANVAYAAQEDGPIIRESFLGDDVDSDDDQATLSYEIVDMPAEGAAFVASSGQFTFNPAGFFQDLRAGATRNVTFTYRAIDQHGAESAIATVTIVVTGVNDPPTAVPDLGETDENTVLTVAAPGVLGNDTDPDVGDTKAVAAVNGLAANVDTQIALASGALLTVRADGSYIYDPNGAFELPQGGTAFDTFTYTVVDGEGATSLATVTITIHGVNDPPTAVSPVAINADEDGPPVLLPFGGDDVDSDDSPSTLRFEVATPPAEGTVIDNGNGTFSFVPGGAFQDLKEGETRVITFTYVAIDRHDARSEPGTVTVTVTGVNDRPEARPTSGVATEDAGPSAPVAFNGFDVDGDALTYRIASLPSEGTVVNNGNGTFTFNPGSDFQDLRTGETRVVTFTYTAFDGRLESLPGTVSITVTGVNEPPVANDDAGANFTTLRNTTATFDIAANDTDVDGTIVRTAASVTIVTLPVNGTVVVNANGTVTYTPRPNFAGLDTFEYTIRDNEGAVSNVATVTVTILNPPNAWQNPRIHTDVNDDGLTTVLDALLVVNDLRDNMRFSGQSVHDLNDLTQLPVAPFRKPFVDPSGDNRVTLGDLLMIITVLREQMRSGGAQEGEGESPSAAPAPFAPHAALVAAAAPSAAAEQPSWPQPAIVAAVPDSSPARGASAIARDEDVFDLGAAGEDEEELDDVLATIAEDVAGRWSEF